MLISPWVYTLHTANIVVFETRLPASACNGKLLVSVSLKLLDYALSYCAPLVSLLKQLGIRCIIYIDDILLLNQDRFLLMRSMAVALDLLQRQAGLNLKTSKCSFHPSQRFQCLGYVWDTMLMQTSVPVKRLKETHCMACRLLRLIRAQQSDTDVRVTRPTIKT
jgi:hypothetical protein